VARWFAEQLRAVLIAWLLLALPVVCHHETATMVLGALGGRSQAHAAVGLAHAHGDHAIAEAPDAAEPDLGASPLPARGPGLVWCAHHPTSATGVLPEGLDNFAPLLATAATPVPGPHAPVAARGLPLPPSRAAPPPAPPPRLARV
jgi:hypothetical protein